MQRKAQGWSIEAIAAEAGIAVRTVHDVLAQREAIGQALLDREPIDIVKRLATQFEASVGDFEAMASAYADTNPNAAIGTKRGADQAREKLLMLLQATGRLPRDMGAIGDLITMRELASEMVQVVYRFKRHLATDDTVRDG